LLILEHKRCKGIDVVNEGGEEWEKEEKERERERRKKEREGEIVIK